MMNIPNTGHQRQIAYQFEAKGPARCKQLLVLVVGGIGSALVGSGFYTVAAQAFPFPEKASLSTLAFLGIGLVLLSAALWKMATPPVVFRVGEGGISRKAKEEIRIPWYGVQRITWEERKGALHVQGTSQEGEPCTLTFHEEHDLAALVKVVREAMQRVPKAVQGDGVEKLLTLSTAEGVAVALEREQWVGKRCAASGKLICYDAQACVCPSCERLYHCDYAPCVCPCQGQQALRSQPAESQPECA